MDTIASLFLLWGNNFFIFGILILGMIWFERELFMHAAYLLLFCILVNVALKVSFQVPLPAKLHKDWFAFPSGHTQAATVFYGWLFYSIPKPLFRLTVLILLLGIGASLIYFGYHTLSDVLAGYFFAILVLLFYGYLLKNWPQKKSWCFLLLASLLLPYIEWQYAQIPAHAWTAYFALLGLVIADSWSNAKKSLLSRRQQSEATLKIMVCFALIYLLFYLLHSGFPQWMYQLKWFFVGLLTPILI